MLLCTRLVLADGSESTTGVHISGLAVAPEHWGKGYGDATLAFFERLLATVGYKFAQLHVLEINHRARRLYERRDWRFVSAGHPHSDGDQAVYEKQLQPAARSAGVVLLPEDLDVHRVIVDDGAAEP